MRARPPRVRPILVLEMSEVPWRLIDRFRDEFPNLNRFFGGSQTYTTVAVDKGELSPWITWPSFHRGMSNAQHGIQFLGQDPASFKGTPIWEEFRSQGFSIGICGSLQSWPPVNPGPGGFFIPDAFAQDERCFPSFVEPFQKLNQLARHGHLAQASDRRELARDLLPLLKSMPRLGIRPATYARLARHLIEERLNQAKSSRRAALETLVRWDVFRKLYRPHNPPAFATFFSGHVAGVMHRHWDSVFPGDFGHDLEGRRKPYNDTMRFALKCVDEVLGDAFGFLARETDLILVWASSVGQDVHRGPRLANSAPGPASHVPEGTLAVYGSGFSPRDDRRRISARDCKDFLLELSGLAVTQGVKAAG